MLSNNSMAEKIFLIRHGETFANKKHIFGGWSDTKLTDLGIAQAKALKKRLGRENIKMIYSSDLVRNKQTVKYANLGGKVVYSKMLRERHYGKLEGTLWKDQKNPEKYHVEPYSRPPGGETPAEVQNRVVKYFRKTIEKDKHDKVLVFGHHGSIILLTMHLLGMPLYKWRGLGLGNASLSILSKEEGVWRVRLWNSLSSLGLKNSGPLFGRKKKH